MQRLKVSGAVRLIYRSLGVKGLNIHFAVFCPIDCDTVSSPPSPAIPRCIWPNNKGRNMLVAMYSSCSCPVELPCTGDQLVTEAATYTTHNKDKERIFMPSVGFEPVIPVIKQLQIYLLDRTATGIDSCQLMSSLFLTSPTTVIRKLFVTVLYKCFSANY